MERINWVEDTVNLQLQVPRWYPSGFDHGQTGPSLIVGGEVGQKRSRANLHWKFFLRLGVPTKTTSSGLF